MLEHEAAVHAELEGMLASALDIAAFEEISRATDSPITLDADECLVVGGRNAFRLVETTQSLGRLKGWTGGIGAPVGPIGVGIGRVNASYEAGPLELAVTDPAAYKKLLEPESGSFHVTNRRAIYLGRVRTGEWRFSDVIAVQQVDNTPDQSTDVNDGVLDIPAATVFHMRGEGNVAGIAYPSTNAHLVRVRIQFAMAIDAGGLEGFAKEIEQRLADLGPPSLPDQSRAV